jgi:hypothetical protein
MPPGQLRQQTAQSALGNLWPALSPQSYRYDDGYLVRLAPNGGVAGYLPLLGGALAPGQQWPAQYNGYRVPDYYSDYYGLPDGYDYRYADGALYSVDPQTNMIQQVAALLTGDQLPQPGVARPRRGGAAHIAAGHIIRWLARTARKQHRRENK